MRLGDDWENIGRDHKSDKQEPEGGAYNTVDPVLLAEMEAERNMPPMEREAKRLERIRRLRLFREKLLPVALKAMPAEPASGAAMDLSMPESPRLAAERNVAEANARWANAKPGFRPSDIPERKAQ